MATAQQSATGGGLLSKLVVVVLLAVTIGLYLRIVVVDAQPSHSKPATQASVQVVEGSSSVSTPATVVVQQELAEDQMLLIKQVFAPELLKN